MSSTKLAFQCLTGQWITCAVSTQYNTIFQTTQLQNEWYHSIQNRAVLLNPETNTPIAHLAILP